MRIFIIGFMGVGKTYWANKLSVAIHIPHIDLDNYVETKAQKSITQIFEENGEKYFRELEASALDNIIEGNLNVIVSCGGGTPCYYDNMQIMKKAGTVIYLRVKNVKDLIYLKPDDAKRPLIHSVNLEKLLKMREPIYKQAHKIVDVNTLNDSNFEQIFLHHE
jgi:shikimate kinase